MLISIVLIYVILSTGSSGVVHLQCFDRLGIDIPDKREWRLVTRPQCFEAPSESHVLEAHSNIVILRSILLSI